MTGKGVDHLIHSRGRRKHVCRPQIRTSGILLPAGTPLGESGRCFVTVQPDHKSTVILLNHFQIIPSFEKIESFLVPTRFF